MVNLEDAYVIKLSSASHKIFYDTKSSNLNSQNHIVPEEDVKKMEEDLKVEAANAKATDLQQEPVISGVNAEKGSANGSVTLNSGSSTDSITQSQKKTKKTAVEDEESSVSEKGKKSDEQDEKKSKIVTEIEELQSKLDAKTGKSSKPPSYS